ncbi:MAG TPA: hypothetical protein VHB99_08445 [Pirellulales bacterium]|nr:hypothetical protein [Pirellulales bacterium]
MLATWFVAGVIACGQADAAAEKPKADAPATEQADLKAQVLKLVRELDAPQKAARDAAEKKLLELGEAALEFLPEKSDRMAAGVALKLDAIRSHFERSQAENSVKSTTVTLKGDSLPLAEVLEAISKQTGNKIYDLREEFGQETTNPDLKIDFDKTPFWAALDQVLDQADLNIYSYASEEGTAIVNRAESRLPRFGQATYSGSFRFEGAEFVARRDLRDPNSHTLQLMVEAAWEPRLQPIVMMQIVDNLEAVDDSGESVPLAMAGQELEFAIDNDMRSVELPVLFDLPERGVKKLASLKGKLSVLLPGKQETFRFTGLDKAKKVERRKANVTVVLDEVRKNNAVWEVRVRVVFDKASGALESHRGWVFNNPAFLESGGKDKETVRYAAMETTRETENEVGMAYLFDVPDGLKGYTFVYRTPTTIVSMPLNYELKDLELP